MREIERGDWDGRDLMGPGVVLEGVRVERCVGPDAQVRIGRAHPPMEGLVGSEPEHRSVVRNVEVVRSRISLLVSGAMLDEVDVEGLNGDGFCKLDAVVFRHVRLAGKIKDVHIQPHGVLTEDAHLAYWRRYWAANAEFYEGVDWALDISEGQFRNWMFRGVPVDKIRIDPSRQAVAEPEALAAARRAFADEELVGVVGLKIKRARAYLGEERMRVNWDVVVQPEAGSKTYDAELELIARLYEGGFVSVPEC